MRHAPFAAGDLVLVRLAAHRIRFIAAVISIDYDSQEALIEIQATGKRYTCPIDRLMTYNP